MSKVVGLNDDPDLLLDFAGSRAKGGLASVAAGASSVQPRSRHAERPVPARAIKWALTWWSVSTDSCSSSTSKTSVTAARSSVNRKH